jgi:ribosomal protein S6
MKNTQEVQGKVYEIGYVLVSSVPEEKVATEVASLKDVLAKAGASIIAEENPELIQLAYTMIKKMHGANHRFDEGYFGWIKFELSPSAIESVKKAIDGMENILRHLLVITVKENTYLGKRSPATAPLSSRDAGIISPEKGIDATIDPAIATATSSADMDKSIDAMVKGV